MKFFRIPKAVLVFYLIIIVGLIVRVVYLSQIRSLWGDEAANFFHAKEPLSMLIKGDYSGFATHPPLSFIIFKFWTLISNDEKWLRLLGTTTSILSIFVVSAIAKELFPKNKYLPVIIAFLFAFSTYQIRSGSEFRYVNLYLFFSGLCLYFFIRAITNKSSVIYCCIFGILALFTDYSFFWLWISIVFYALFLLAKKLKGSAIQVPLSKVFICIVVPVAAFLPWLPKFLNSLNFSLFSGYISRPQFIDIPALLLSYLVAFPTRNGISADAYHWWQPIRYVVGNDYIAKLLYLILSNTLLVAGLSKLMYHNKNNSLRFMKVIIILPVILSFAVSQKNPIFVDYNLQIVSIGVMIILAAFICEHKKIGACILIIYTILNLLSLKVLFQHETVMEEWKSVVSNARNTLDVDKALILIYPNVNIFPIKYYLLQYNLNDQVSLLDLDNNDIEKDVHMKQLLTMNYQKVCLVTYKDMNSYARKIFDFLSTRYTNTDAFISRGIYLGCFQ